MGREYGVVLTEISGWSEFVRVGAVLKCTCCLFDRFWCVLGTILSPAHHSTSQVKLGIFRAEFFQHSMT